MVNKAWAYLIPFLILAISALILTGRTYPQGPGSPVGQVDAYQKALKADITREQWDKAPAGLKSLTAAWDKAVTQIQFSAGRDEIKGFNLSLARLAGFIEAKNQAGALAELGSIQAHWHNLKK